MIFGSGLYAVMAVRGMVIDRWAGKVEHERALKQPELRPFVEESLPLLVGMPEQITIRPSGRTTCSTE